jgi:HSP20 family protein
MFSLVHRNPTLRLSPLDEVDRLFDDLVSSFSTPTSNLMLPSVDVYSEDDRNTVVEMQVPGFDREDIDIRVTSGMLEVRGQRVEKEEHKDKKRSYVVRENSQSFARRIALPEGADSDKIAAELDKGVLTITIPVAHEDAKRVQIAAPKSSGKAKLTAAAETKQEGE